MSVQINNAKSATQVAEPISPIATIVGAGSKSPKSLVRHYKTLRGKSSFNIVPMLYTYLMRRRKKIQWHRTT